MVAPFTPLLVSRRAARPDSACVWFPRTYPMLVFGEVLIEQQRQLWHQSATRRPQDLSTHSTIETVHLLPQSDQFELYTTLAFITGKKQRIKIKPPMMGTQIPPPMLRCPVGH